MLRSRLALAALCPLLALTACGGEASRHQVRVATPEQLAASATPAAVAEPAPAPKADAGRSKSATKERKAEPKLAAAPPPPAPTAVTPAIATPVSLPPVTLPGGAEAAKLKGLSAVQVKSVLGQPAYTRRDAPAEIWQYRGRACTLDVFLYDTNGTATVAHSAVRSQGGAVSEKDCLDELLGRAKAG
jgi:hypothetical protein